MARVKISITTEDGEVLAQLTAALPALTFDVGLGGIVRDELLGSTSLVRMGVEMTDDNMDLGEDDD